MKKSVLFLLLLSSLVISAQKKSMHLSDRAPLVTALAIIDIVAIVHEARAALDFFS